MDHQHASYDYMAHGYCFSWEPGLVWLHVASDVITGIAYYSIPVAMFYVVYKRRDIPFYRMFLLFAVFILSCGTTHFFAAYTVFVPAYWPEGYAKAFTAIVSAISAALFIPLLPKVIAMPSLSRTLTENKELNKQLQRKIEELQKTAGHLEMVNHELQVSESRFRAIFDTTYDAIFVHEVPSGAIIDANQTACEMYGYTRQELVSLTIEDLSAGIPPYIQATALEWIRRVMAGKPQSFEWQAKGRNGRLFWVEMNMKFATIGDSDRILVGVSDITERRNMADSLRKAKEYTDKVIQSANVLIVCMNAGGAVTLLNRTAEVLLGYSRDEIERNGYETFIPPDVLPDVKAEFRRLLTEGRPGTFENPIITKAGERRIISWRNSPITDNGDITGTISFGIDITEHRKIEAQLIHAQKMEAIGTLAGGIAHDFNNILTTIIGFGSLLTMRLDENDPNRAKVEKILKAAERATALTQGLLAYSRKEAVDLRPVDLNEIVVKFDHFLSKIIGEDIDLKIIPTDGRLLILADVGQIEQVLMNLAANARDAMPGGGSLFVRVEETEIDSWFIASHGYGQEGRYAMLTVVDTGTGMDSATQEHIFEPYFTTKEIGKGTGLGLPIVYGIIKQHHGFINVYSEPGTGTTFRVYLPLTGLAPEEGHEEMPVIAHGMGELILMAEDNEEIRSFLRHLLAENGYRVLEAVDGEEALELFRQYGDEISLLLLDVIMPRKNGKETFDEIQAINAGIKALFMSGYTADIISQTGIYTEGLEFISKPFSPHALLRKIRAALNGTVASR
jgi:PAS domain S-box-containing protein